MTRLGPTGATGPSAEPTLAAYEALAPHYDRFTGDYQHRAWLGAIEAWARAEGLRGLRLLDVACGTGKSFEPMLALGYAVTACDLSPEMTSRAQRRAAGTANVVVADMRALPWWSRFDLVTCINDSINYLLTHADLAAALGGMADALAPGGVAIFDTNSLATYRTAFASNFVRRCEGCTFHWEGQETKAFRPGAVATARLDLRENASVTRRTSHVQRHWPLAALRSACATAGFDRILFRGQLPGGRLMDSPDEERHTKVVCLATKPRARRRRSLHLRGPTSS